MIILQKVYPKKAFIFYHYLITLLGAELTLTPKSNTIYVYET